VFSNGLLKKRSGYHCGYPSFVNPNDNMNPVIPVDYGLVWANHLVYISNAISWQSNLASTFAEKRRKLTIARW